MIKGFERMDHGTFSRILIITALTILCLVRWWWFEFNIAIATSQGIWHITRIFLWTFRTHRHHVNQHSWAMRTVRLIGFVIGIHESYHLISISTFVLHNGAWARGCGGGVQFFDRKWSFFHWITKRHSGDIWLPKLLPFSNFLGSVISFLFFCYLVKTILFFTVTQIYLLRFLAFIVINKVI